MNGTRPIILTSDNFSSQKIKFFFFPDLKLSDVPIVGLVPFIFIAEDLNERRRFTFVTNMSLPLKI